MQFSVKEGCCHSHHFSNTVLCCSLPLLQAVAQIKITSQVTAELVFVEGSGIKLNGCSVNSMIPLYTTPQYLQQSSSSESQSTTV